MATKRPATSPAPAPTTSPLPGFDTRDTSGRHSTDALLRKGGWRIHGRPRRGPARWLSPNGRVLPHAEALRTLDPNDVSDARYAESLFYGLSEDLEVVVLAGPN